MTAWQFLIRVFLAFVSVQGVATAEGGQRDHIMVVGSSTAFPIVSAAAERFQRNSGKPSPVVISMGTGGGFKLFCSDKGLESPDITMASRQLKPSERALCQANDIEDIVELKFGYDGIVFASAKSSAKYHFRMTDLYLALAREVPDPEGRPKLIPNPYQRWSQINPNLPDRVIRVFGPPPTSGTRDILVERLLDPACQQYDFMQTMMTKDIDGYRYHCHTFREDGVYVNAGENDARVVRKLVDDGEAIGIIGYNFLDQNSDLLQAATIEGVAPEFEVIESSRYPLTRPLYLYINRFRNKFIDSLDDFIHELTSDDSWGEDGYLVDKGLIPLTAMEREHWRKKASILQ